MKQNARAYARPRPIRVAYLVDELQEHSSTALSAIFSECMSRWGGRFSLIVPTTSEGPRESYEAWLRMYDPDIVYSYVDLNERAQAALQEQLYPSFLVKHEHLQKDRNDIYAMKPRLPINGLLATTLLPRVAAPQFDQTKGVQIVSAAGRMQTDLLALDSFGSLSMSVEHGLSVELQEFASELVLVSEEDSKAHPRLYRNVAKTVSDIATLFEAMTEGRVTTMSQLSAIGTPRLDVYRLSNIAFNLVVGDSFADRIYYWNARCLFPKWHDGHFVDLRLSEAALDDPRALSALGQLLKQRNRVVSSHDSSTPRIHISSSSIAQDRLTGLADALRASNSWMGITTSDLSLDSCLPTGTEVSRARYIVSEGAFNRIAATWQEHQVQGNQLELISSGPQHLRYCPPALLSPQVGCWAIDLDIERARDHSPFANVRHHWRFPRRLRITRAFLKGYELDSGFGIVMPRASREGFLTIYADATSRLPLIDLASDEVAIETGLTTGRDWWPFERKRGDDAQLPEQLLSEVKRSSSGRHLFGVLKLFGSLNEAQDILLHAYWRDVFAKLGGTASTVEARRDVVLRRLKKRISESEADDIRNIEKLAGIVLDEAEHFRSATPVLDWSGLHQTFLSYQSKAWARENVSHLNERERDEWKTHEVERLRSGVQDLCRKGVLYQGYEYRCQKCLHRTWIAIEALRGEVVCEVCRRSERAPVDTPWDFRLNEFLREGVRKHGVLPLVWTLAKLRRLDFREVGFFFEAPLDVYADKRSWEGGRPTTDIDLTCVIGVEVFMCEVKQSARQLHSSEIEKFAALMLRLRPNYAVLAVMEADCRPIQKAFELLTHKLAGEPIQPLLLTFHELTDIDHGCQL